MAGIKIVDMINEKERLCIAKREGYFAIVEMETLENGKIDFSKIKDFVSPFAFTGYYVIENTHFIGLSRFGKKGLFDLDLKRYTIPCKYEELKVVDYDHNNDLPIFSVKKDCYVGLIKGNGNWIEKFEANPYFGDDMQDDLWK